MFTGLIETIGEIVQIIKGKEIVKMKIRAGSLAGDVSAGDSVSVSGACLTVCDVFSDSFTAEMISETWSSTTLGHLRQGMSVNLERALSVSGRLDGHIVTGHVDGLAVLRSRKDMGGSYVYSFEAGKDLLTYIVKKGSIAVDGVSLTIIDIGGDLFSVGIIPTTLRETTLGSMNVGDSVNIETDILAKYVFRSISIISERAVDQTANAPGLTWEKLTKYGWST